MSKLFGNLFSKLIFLFAVILFIIAFRDSILTDDTIADAFSELMQTLPFSDFIINGIRNAININYDFPTSVTTDFATDIMKLLVMACIQPLFISLLSMIFLGIPRNLGVDGAERYMERPSYKIKEMLITVITAPLLAVLAALITTTIFNFFSNSFNVIVASIMKVLSVIVAGGLSLIPLLIAGTAIGTAIAWRVLITIGAKVVGTFITNAICIWLYMAIVGGVQAHIISSIVSLIIWLLVMDFGIKCLQRAVV